MLALRDTQSYHDRLKSLNAIFHQKDPAPDKVQHPAQNVKIYLSQAPHFHFLIIRASPYRSARPELG